MDVVMRLGAAVTESQRPDEIRAKEIGGLLLGLSQPGEQRVTVVEDFEPLTCEHVRGPSFTLSSAERKSLEEKLRRGSIRGLSVVGFYRSHTRPGLYLDQDDFAVIDGCFAHPSQVMLLVRPSAAGMTAGCFFWEEGDMRRQASYLEFPFDAKQLFSGNHRLCKRSEHWVPEPVQVAARPAPGTAARAWLRGIRLPTQPRTVLLLIAAMFLGASFLAIRKPVKEPSPASAESARSGRLALQVQKSGDGFRLAWDQNSPLVRTATAAALRIRDDASDYRLDLPPRQLATGSVMYFPTGSDISFELEVSGAAGRVSEIVRAFSPGPPRIPDVAQLPPWPPVPIQAVSDPPPRPSRKQAADRTAPAVRRFVALPARASVTTPAALPAPPPNLAYTASAFRPLAGPLAGRLQQEATVSLGPARPVSSPLRRIPALLRLQRPSDTVKGFVPPRPVRQIKLVIPASLAKPSSGDIALDLKLRVDESGNVVDTQVLRDSAPKPISSSVLSAAREWRFVPALMNGKAVTSHTLVRFRFEP